MNGYSIKMRYSEWCGVALVLGYYRSSHDNNHLWRNGKKWIMNSWMLLRELQLDDVMDLVDHGYAVGDYLLFKDMTYREFMAIFFNLSLRTPIAEASFSGEGSVAQWLMKNTNFN